MSSYVFSSFTGRTIVEANIDANMIMGSNGSDYPVLIIPIDLAVYYPYQQPGFAIELRELRCRLAPFDAGYMTGITSFPMHGRATAECQEYKVNSVYLEFPFAYDRLALLERLRKSGDMTLRLECELWVDELVEIGRTKEGYPAPIWGVKYRHRLTSQARLGIPRTVWLEHVLAQTGYGKVYLVELPVVPIDSCAGLKEAYDALHQAQELYKQGFYNEAVGRCRVALEPFFEKVERTTPDGEKKSIPVMKRSWETKLGEATYKWLNASFTAIKEPTNKPHHSSTPYFDQLDAQLLLAVTTALIAYAVQTRSDPTTC